MRARGSHGRIGHAKPADRRLESVEAARQLDQRLVTAGTDIGENGRDRVADVGRLLAARFDQGGEGGSKSGIPGIQPDRHAGATLIQSSLR